MKKVIMQSDVEPPVGETGDIVGVVEFVEGPVVPVEQSSAACGVGIAGAELIGDGQGITVGTDEVQIGIGGVDAAGGVIIGGRGGKVQGGIEFQLREEAVGIIGVEGDAVVGLTGEAGEVFIEAGGEEVMAVVAAAG